MTPGEKLVYLYEKCKVFPPSGCWVMPASGNRRAYKSSRYTGPLECAPRKFRLPPEELVQWKRENPIENWNIPEYPVTPSGMTLEEVARYQAAPEYEAARKASASALAKYHAALNLVHREQWGYHELALMLAWELNGARVPEIENMECLHHPYCELLFHMKILPYRCTNPLHLRWGTDRENEDDMNLRKRVRVYEDNLENAVREILRCVPWPEIPAADGRIVRFRPRKRHGLVPRS